MVEEKPKGVAGVPKAEDKSTSDIDSSVEEVSDFELRGLSLVLVFVGLALAVFLMSLDSAIISTAISRITSQFNSTGDIGCFPMKGMFLGCLAVLQLGSLLCALAVNSPMLIVGRAIAGAGAAGCCTGGFCIVAVSLPLEKRPFAVAILQSSFGIATIIGPLLGGAFTQHSTWRWCFWINLPLGAVTILTLVFFFNPPSRNSTKVSLILHRLESLDLLGAIFFAPAVIMILLAVQWGGTEYAWKSATIIGLFIGGAGLGVIFAFWQVYRGEKAMIPPRLFTNRMMFFACFAEFFALGAVCISIYYIPEWFQVVKNASPATSGVMYLPLALSDVLSTIIAGASLKYLGYPNLYILFGTALMSIATGLFPTFTTTTPHQHWIPFQALQGLGAGMTMSMPYVATQIILKPEDIPVGTSLLQCLQFFGAAVSLAVAEATFENRLVSGLASSGYTEEAIENFINAGSTSVRSVVPKCVRITTPSR
ncbi:Major facilitator superfamily domain general substrate transporter [Penicillium macrosclerotiorum]|uniref:Major facilitator superfamily domain general substrate transporter n=1 Tax=Penicillium macrosclerotiorum TaxID=303699 RepID=UPI00254761CA|nr:Major facilitator superfamily domain general substrate transporter [Penicillium macrosclerotiorum]KAJ5673758.1 Major facilitator superfamily domain general substrate transporter [Penicillium macrosclerotiorum]